MTGQLVEALNIYRDSTKEGSYDPTFTRDIVIDERVFRIDFDRRLTAEQKAKGLRKAEVTASLDLPEAWNLFKEVNARTYEEQTLFVIHHYRANFSKFGGNRTECSPLMRPTGSLGFVVPLRGLEEIESYDFRFEKDSKYEIFNPDHIAVPTETGNELSLNRFNGNVPENPVSKNLIHVYDVKSMDTRPADLMGEHLRKLEDAITACKFEGESIAAKDDRFWRDDT